MTRIMHCKEGTKTTSPKQSWSLQRVQRGALIMRRQQWEAIPLLALLLLFYLADFVRVHAFGLVVLATSRRRLQYPSRPFRRKAFLSAKAPAPASAQEPPQPQHQHENPDVKRLQQEAARMRLEAEKMDWELTNRKLRALQEKAQKLRKQKDPSKQADAMEAMQQQIDQLRKKLSDEASKSNKRGTKKLQQNKTESTIMSSMISSSSTTTTTPTKVVLSPSGEATAADTSSTSPSPSSSVLVVERPKKEEESLSTTAGDEDEEWAVFDQDDFDLYLPVATEIEQRLTNATLDEKLEAFRTAPELQTHFKQKIAELIVEPFQEMQRLQELQSKYLASSSIKEKEHLKPQIDKLSKALNEETGRFQYSDSICRDIPALTEDQIRFRVETVQALPLVLQSLYKRRYQLDSNSTDVRLAVLLDHYEQQMQLLDQVKLQERVGDAMRQEVAQAVDSLPKEVRDHIAVGLGLDRETYDTNALVKELSKGEESDESNWSPLSPLSGVVLEAMEMPDAPEYNDIAFVDRSRYVDEFYPAVARMEKLHPSEKDVEGFIQKFIDKKAFMVTSKPERVIGGWYIRGRNLLDEEDNGSGVKLMDHLQQRVNDTSLQYFYIPDPSPLTDEEVELEFRSNPLILVTANDPTKFYNYAEGRVKASVSTLGLVSMGVFALGVCALEPTLQDRLNAEIANANSGGLVDVSWLTSIASEVMLSLISIQVAHDLGHRIIAWRDKFEVGLSTPVPSIQFGCLGTITPLKSPPPSLKSLFDFGVAGPLLGMVASLAFLVQGLTMTAALDVNQAVTLPVLPVDLVRTSALGGGLVETFLGRGAIIQGMSDGFVPLHPFAISGFVGILINALALLPLGNTDGGRIALAMFGRRGAYIVKTFTTALLCIAGIAGFDNASVLLTYVLFVVIWQRELEAPARNEVEEVDFLRGASGIAMAIFVALTLIPMQ